MLDEIKKRLHGYKLEVITKLNFEQVFEVYNSNQKFFQLTDGKDATIESSVNDIDAVPPGFDVKQKVYVGICKDDSTVGVLDLLKGYPTQTCVYIGLLLVHGKFHGNKIGSKIVEAVASASKIAGYKSIQLGVIANNIAGINFWQLHGFEEIRTAQNIIVMERQI